jgi:hypothetical protein
MLEEYHKCSLRQTHFCNHKDETQASQGKRERKSPVASMGFCQIIVVGERWLLLFCACVQMHQFGIYFRIFNEQSKITDIKY